MTTIRLALGAATRTLQEAGIDSAALEARVLLAHALGTTRARLVMEPDGPVPSSALNDFTVLIRRRAQGEPVAYLTGTREFYGRTFQVTRDVLIPRPDSETLIDAVLAAFPDRGAAFRVLDLGVGSGALLVTLLAEFPRAEGVGVDRSAAAIAVARANAVSLGAAPRARFLCGHWMEALSARFDLILANPPYIPHAVIGELARDVRDFEPRLALDGGPDGLAAYRAIIGTLRDHLDPEGLALFECGADQAPSLQGLFAAEGLAASGAIVDLSGHARSVAAASVANKPFLTLKKALGV